MIDMKIFKNAESLQNHVASLKRMDKTIGFVPTMGALHEGHFSLVNQSNKESDITICSIFVNPTQFNEKSDLIKYPRTLDADISGLEQSDCDILFIPSVEEIYPHGSDYKVDVDLEGLDQFMEGEKRPGHFDGVVQVVKRLIECTSCDRIYMGQKDFQQFSIINKMIDQLKLPVKLVVCPIFREVDGLAMSSRNVRLTAQNRKKASIIYRVLNQAEQWLNEGKPLQYITEMAMEFLEIPDFSPEYFILIDGRTLLPLKENDAEIIVACTAVWAGDVRLIDNKILKGDLNI